MNERPPLRDDRHRTTDPHNTGFAMNSRGLMGLLLAIIVLVLLLLAFRYCSNRATPADDVEMIETERVVTPPAAPATGGAPATTTGY